MLLRFLKCSAIDSINPPKSHEKSSLGVKIWVISEYNSIDSRITEKVSGRYLLPASQTYFFSSYILKYFADFGSLNQTIKKKVNELFMICKMMCVNTKK